jgi:hypothetical protein
VTTSSGTRMLCDHTMMAGLRLIPARGGVQFQELA